MFSFRSDELVLDLGVAMGYAIYDACLETLLVAFFLQNCIFLCSRHRELNIDDILIQILNAILILPR